MPTPKTVEVTPNACPHRDLEFELGGRTLACRDCGQRYHAVSQDVNGVGMGAEVYDRLDQGYYNIWILHKDRRTWAFALADKPKKT